MYARLRANARATRLHVRDDARAGAQGLPESDAKICHPPSFSSPLHFSSPPSSLCILAIVHKVSRVAMVASMLKHNITATDGWTWACNKHEGNATAFEANEHESVLRNTATGEDAFGVAGRGRAWYRAVAEGGSLVSPLCLSSRSKAFVRIFSVLSRPAASPCTTSSNTHRLAR